MESISSESKNKFISLIITAHSRRNYLKRAIQSAMNQSLSKDFYEIIIVKDFEDIEIDDIIVRNGIKSIKASENSKVGEDLYLGIINSTGEIISFLDDDDTFLPNKLESVYTIFKKFPNVVFYHNYQTFENINQSNSSYHGIRGLFTSNDLRNKLKEFFNRYGSFPLFFNLSSISIRKNYYTEYLNDLKKLIAHSDDFFFFIGLEGDGKLYFDDLALTKYTVHESTSNVDKLSNSKIDYFKKKSEIAYRSALATSYIKSIIHNRQIISILSARSDIELLESKIYQRKFDLFLFAKCIINARNYGIKWTIYTIYSVIQENF